MQKLKTILQELKTTEGTMGIVSHINPDGDGFCASLFLAAWLKLASRDADIITDGDDLLRFSHLLGDASIKAWEPGMSYDTLVVLDCNSMSRLGNRGELVSGAKLVIVIDHHEVENHLISAHYSFINQDFVCVGAILFEALEDEIRAFAEPDRQYLASCLYTTVLNDTNTFTNGNTTAGVLNLAGRIASLGINASRLHRAYFQNQSWQEIRYTGEVLATTEVHLNGRILLLWSTLEMAQENQIEPGDVLNVTRWVQGVRGIQAVIFIREEAVDFHKLSFRSMKVDVSKLAGSYGGGGHRNAAGCHLEGRLEDVKERVLKDMILALEQAGD